MMLKWLAPSSVRKQPEIFCLTLGMRAARSPRLLANGGAAKGIARLCHPSYKRARRNGNAIQIVNQQSGTGKGEKLPLSQVYHQCPQVGAVLHCLRYFFRERTRMQLPALTHLFQRTMLNHMASCNWYVQYFTSLHHLARALLEWLLAAQAMRWQWVIDDLCRLRNSLEIASFMANLPTCQFAR